MLTHTEQDDVVTLTGELDIYAVGELKPALARARVVDCAGVESVDGAGLQLLVWWRRAGHGRTVRGPSACVRQAWQALGLDSLGDTP